MAASDTAEVVEGQTVPEVDLERGLPVLLLLAEAEPLVAGLDPVGGRLEIAHEKGHELPHGGLLGLR